MILAKMEYQSVARFPMNFTDCLSGEFGEKLLGRSRKKKQMVSVLKSHVANTLRKCQADHSYVACDNVTDGFGGISATCEVTAKKHQPDYLLDTGVDMEGFYQISVDDASTESADISSFDCSMENNVDISNIMLSSHSGRTQSESSTCTAVSSLSDLDVDGLSAIGSVGLLPSDTEIDNEGVPSPNAVVPSVAAPAPFPDLSSFLIAGSLLSDIELHDLPVDIYAQDGEDGNSLLAYCPRAMKQEPSWDVGPSMMEQLDNFLHGDDAHSDDTVSDVKPDLSLDDYLMMSDNSDASTLDKENKDMFSEEDETSNQQNRKASKRKATDCQSDRSLHIRQKLDVFEESIIDDDDDECIYSSDERCHSSEKSKKLPVSHNPRKGPGRPRKSSKQIVRRGPGRPRKKSVSDTIAWYQSQRKRTVSFSHKSRNSSTSPVRYQLNDSAVVVPSKTKLAGSGKGSRQSQKVVLGRGKSSQLRRNGSDNGRQRNLTPNSEDEECRMNRLLGGSPMTITPCETDDDDIVDVVTVNDGSLSENLCELYDVSSMGELLRHISLMHCYHSVRPVTYRCTPGARRYSAAIPPSGSTSKFSINLPVSPKKGTPSWSSDSCSGKIRGGQSKKLTAEQRAKRESLNDLERQRRCDLSRAMTALRTAVPTVRENSRAAKIAVLESAVDHIKLLERQFKQEQSVLKAERDRYTALKEQLGQLSSSD